MFCIAPAETLLDLDLMYIPEANTNCITHSQDSINPRLEKNIKSRLALREAKKIQFTKTSGQNRKRIASNPRKEAGTTNSQKFTW